MSNIIAESYINNDPSAASVRRIRYAQYMCESKRESHFNEKSSGPRHIIFVVNLVRGSNSLSESSRYMFDFDKRWNHVFIDDITVPNGSDLPLFDLVNTPLTTILDTTIPLMEILQENTTPYLELHIHLQEAQS